jgi:regulator of protease activity HflC (stomatin/prohibitin superfamily)
MAAIGSLLFWRHVRADPTAHVLHFSSGKLARSGRGLSFWFFPLWSTLAEIPCDDRDQAFLFHARSQDFQEVTAQGAIAYRVANPEALASRVDFSIDPATGLHKQSPLEHLAGLLTQLAQQLAWEYLAKTPLRELLSQGVEQVRDRIREGLLNDPALGALGLEVVSVRVSSVAPTAELEKALQAPTREAIQQESDEATFQRRALAVEKERAIQENELQNQIELAKREEQLIAQRGQNELRRAREEAESKKVESLAHAERTRLGAETEAAGIELVERARVGSERERIEIYRDLPTSVLMGLAARELAGKLQRIDHLNLSPESFGPLLTNLIQAQTRRLEEEEG